VRCFAACFGSLSIIADDDDHFANLNLQHGFICHLILILHEFVTVEYIPYSS